MANLMYELLPSDKYNQKRNTRKYLTTKKVKKYNVKVTNANERMNKMHKDKNRNNKITEQICLALLAIAAVNGIAAFLGGSVRAVLAAAVLSTVLLERVWDK